jgi:hypothetical protein
MPARTLGYLRDKPDTRDRLLSAHRLGQVAFPPEFDLTPHIGQVLDQGPCSGCVGHAWSQALRVSMAAAGEPSPEYPSPLAGYYWARAESGSEHEDAGTYIRDAAKAFSRFGLPGISVWPQDFTKVNVGPGPAVYRAGYDRRGMHGYVRIPAGDTDGINRAVANGCAVVFGLELGYSFLDYDGHGVIDRDSGGIAGGHAMAVVGYRPGQKRIISSWGTGWGAGGLAWITDRRMSEAEDVWIADPEDHANV